MYSPLPHPSMRWSVATTAFLLVAGPILAFVMILGLVAVFFELLWIPPPRALTPPPMPPKPAQHAK